MRSMRSAILLTLMTCSFFCVQKTAQGAAQQEPNEHGEDSVQMKRFGLCVATLNQPDNSDVCESFLGVAFSPVDSHTFVSACPDRKVKRWAYRDGVWHEETIMVRSAGAQRIAYSIDTVACAGEGGDISLVDEQGVFILGEADGGHFNGEITALCFSHDGRFLISAGNNDESTNGWIVDIKIWYRDDDNSWECIQTLTEQHPDFHRAMISELAFAPDDSYFVSISMDVDRTVKKWVLDQGGVWRCAWTMDAENTENWHEKLLNGFAFSGDGQYAASVCCGGKLIAWDVHQDPWEGDVVFDLNQQHVMGKLACSRQGNYLAYGVNETILLCSRRDGIWRRKGLLTRSEADGKRLTSLSFSPDEKHIVACYQDGVVKVWLLEEGIRTLADAARCVLHERFAEIDPAALTCLPDNDLVIAGLKDMVETMKTIRLDSVFDGQE